MTIVSLFIAPLPLPTAWAPPRPCVCTRSHARLLSSAPFAQKVHIPSLKYQRTGVRWVFKSHQCWFSTDGVPPGNQGGNNGLSMDGRPLCPRCGEPFSGTFSTMSKSCSLSPLSLEFMAFHMHISLTNSHHQIPRMLKMSSLLFLHTWQWGKERQSHQWSTCFGTKPPSNPKGGQHYFWLLW